MKRLIKTLALSAVVMSIMTTTNVAYAKTLNMTYNGTPVVSQVDNIVERGYTLVSLRAIADAIGCTTNYDAGTKKITVTKSDTVVEMWQGTSTAKVNGDTVIMDIMSKNHNGYTMVPLRFLTTAFGCEVEYNQYTKEITLTSDGYKQNSSLPSSGETKPQSGPTDPWGSELKKDNLPASAKYFPYIRQEIPNWVYDNIAKTWNNNYWGGVNSEKYKGYRKLFESPADMWADPQFGTNFWNREEFAYDPDVPRFFTTKEFYDMYITEHLNPDYRKLDSKGGCDLTYFSDDAISPYGLNPSDLDTILATIYGYTKAVKKTQMIINSDVKIIYEGVWKDSEYTDLFIHVPVYAKMKFESVQGDNYFGTYGHNTTRDSDMSKFIKTKSGDEVEVVLTYTLFQNPETKKWQLWYPKLQMNKQWAPTINLTDGVAPQYFSKDEARLFRYDWMKDNAGLIDKHATYDYTKLAK